MKWLIVTLIILLPVLSSAQQCTQAQLNSEFTADPTARTYASCGATDDNCVLVKFNAPCTDAACKVDQIVTKEMFYEAIDKDELKAIADVSTTDATQLGSRFRRLQVALLNDTFDMSKASVRQKLLDVFPAPSAPLTNAAIVALQQKNVPRSQIVCGRPATHCDISLGRRGVGC